MKKVTLHTLKHSYDTHLLEGGTDLRYIQVLLGHRSSKTTEIYPVGKKSYGVNTHVSRKNLMNIRNPLDNLRI